MVSKASKELAMVKSSRSSKELETIIVINSYDIEEGYVLFGTSIASHWSRLERIVGDARVEVDVKLKDGRFVYGRCKVPKAYYSRGSFGIKKPVKRKELSEDERMAARERFKKNINKGKSNE